MFFNSEILIHWLGCHYVWCLSWRILTACVLGRSKSLGYSVSLLAHLSCVLDFLLTRCLLLCFQGFQHRVAPLQGRVDQVNDLASQIQVLDVVLSHIPINKLEGLNSRCVAKFFLCFFFCHFLSNHRRVILIMDCDFTGEKKWLADFLIYLARSLSVFSPARWQFNVCVSDSLAALGNSLEAFLHDYPIQLVGWIKKYPRPLEHTALFTVQC